MHNESAFSDLSQNFIETLRCVLVTGEPRWGASIDEVFWTLFKQIESVRDNKGTIFFIGNGGSAAIATHMSMDFSRKCCNSLSISDAPTLTATANDYGFERIFAHNLERLASPGDMLFAISSSGQSKNIVEACQTSAKIGIDVVTLTGMSPGNPVSSVSHLNIHVPSRSYSMIEVAHHLICHLLLEYVTLQMA